MLLLILFICAILICYGFIRTILSLKRQEKNAYLHALWIPAGAMLYALSVSVLLFVMQ